MFDYTNANKENQELQVLLKKNKIKGDQCLFGLNIPYIQEKYAFSRFELYRLYTDYSTLIKFSHYSLNDFKKGF
jgi:hypothetical protein